MGKGKVKVCLSWACFILALPSDLYKSNGEAEAQPDFICLKTEFKKNDQNLFFKDVLPENENEKNYSISKQLKSDNIKIIKKLLWQLTYNILWQVYYLWNTTCFLKETENYMDSSLLFRKDQSFQNSAAFAFCSAQHQFAYSFLKFKGFF